MGRLKGLGLSIALFGLAGSAAADQLTLTNGDRLSGTVTSKAGEWLTFETSYAGKLKIRWTDVAELVTEAPVAVMLDDRSQRSASYFSDDPKDANAVPTTAVSHINPPAAVTGDGWDFSGRIDVGLNQTSGNTDTQAYHLDAESVARSGANRITGAATYNQASDSGQESIDNASLSAKYDRFINKRWYGYGYAKLQRDEFKDLKLRRELGVGLGHQFYDSPERKLALEAGLTQVNEDYYQAPDDSGLSVRWATDYQQRFYRDLLTLFHRNELTVPVDDTGNFLVTAKTGVRVPVADGLTATAEVDIDYDNEPPAGNENTDWLYLFSLGYHW